ISTVDYSILPGLLSAYRAAHPGVTLELRELTSDVQLRELHEGRIDAGMMLAPVDDTALAMLPLLREPLVAALPADDPLARGHRRLDRGRRDGAVHGRSRLRRRLRQEHAGLDDGDGADERARDLRLRRHDQ